MGRVQSIASTSSQGKSRVRELGSTGRGAAAVHHVARGGSGRAMERLEGDWRALNAGRARILKTDYGTSSVQVA